MKTITTAICVGAMLAGASLTNAEVITQGSGSVNTAIPDGNVSGLQSTINISGSGITSIQNVDVTLNISGGYNGDLYAYLTSENGGGFAVLLNRIGQEGGNGGYSSSGITGVKFSNNGSYDDIHTYGGGTLSGGTYSPDGRNVNPLTAQTSDSRTASLLSFNGGNANGNWTLFVADVSGEYTSQLDSWELEITGVPEPVDYALMAFGGIFATVQGMRYMKKRKLATA